MDGRRQALIVASDEFEHPGLSRLRAPSADATALAEVLGDPDIGDFDVRVVHNSPSHTVQAQIEDLFAEGRPDDLLLLHFSGHGLKSDSGELFFAAPNTRPDRLASTAVSADFVQRCIRASRARSIVLFLDCCYGGAFGEGVAVRAAGPANVLDSFPAGKLGGGRGRAVITASSAMEYAFEGSALATDDQKQPSVFTAAVVEGLSSGAADRDEDGLVSLNELYDYVFDQVRAQNPNQTPSRDIELQGELYVAKSHRKRVRPVPLPPDLRAALHDANMYTRLGAVGELRNRFGSADPGVALGAQQALQDVARSDTSYVADAARDALAVRDLADPAAQHPSQPAPASEPVAFMASPSAAMPAGSPTTAQAPASPPATPPPSAPAQAPASAPAQAPDSAPATVPPPAPSSAPGNEVTPPPTQSPASPSTPRHRSTAGRIALTAGALLLLSAALPEFVYGASSFAFRRSIGVTLLVLGALSIGVGCATLWLPRMGSRWAWPVVVLAVASLLTTWGLLNATADLGASELYLGLWVALTGCLTATAAGVVAVIGLRPEQASPTAGPTPEPPSPLARASGWGAVVAGGLTVAATFAVRFVHGEQALVGTHHVWAWLFPGWLGVIAGLLTLNLLRRPMVGPALTAGAGAAAVWGLWDMPRIWRAEGPDALNSGYFLEFAGLVGLVTAAVVALVALQRDHALALTRGSRTTVALIGVVGLLAAVPFLRVARLSWESSETGDAVHDVQMAIFALAVPVVATTLRPRTVGRFLLLGWSVGATGIVVAYWRLLRGAEAPLLGIPYVLVALAALAVAATVNGLWQSRDD